MRRTKIVATLGPATDGPGVLEALLQAGVDIVRINFSHGHHGEHKARLNAINALEERYGPVAVLVDTRGPELRLGRIPEGPITLTEGQKILLTGQDVSAAPRRLPVSYGDFYRFLKPNDRILLSDGLVELEVLEVNQEVLCRVLNGGEISSFKGINTPGISMNLPSLTQQDREDISFAIEQEVDFVASSFVRQPQDVIEIRRLIEEQGGHQHIIAKIENQEGVEHVAEILELADGLMVARGDLGVEIPPEKIPALQKTMIRQCNRVGKPVITATQMLESMIYNPRPTRAEASDVANAIYDGTDATMLSGETAIGRYPVETVKTMARIAVETEGSLSYGEILNHKRFRPLCTVTDSISYSTCDTAHDLQARAIITATRSGFTARMVSKYRPRSPIAAATPNQQVLKKLILSWGVYPLLVEPTDSTDKMIEASVEAALVQGIISQGDLVVITAGSPVGVPGTTNLLKVHIAGDIIIQGVGIGQEAVTGQVHRVKSPEDLKEELDQGVILVTPTTTPEMVPFLGKIAALITEEGGLTSHGAILGLELGIPVVVGAENATTILKENALITVDSSRGIIYSGRTKVL